MVRIYAETENKEDLEVLLNKVAITYWEFCTISMPAKLAQPRVDERRAAMVNFHRHCRDNIYAFRRRLTFALFFRK